MQESQFFARLSGLETDFLGEIGSRRTQHSWSMLSTREPRVIKPICEERACGISRLKDISERQQGASELHCPGSSNEVWLLRYWRTNWSVLLILSPRNYCLYSRFQSKISSGMRSSATPYLRIAWVSSSLSVLADWWSDSVLTTLSILPLIAFCYIIRI